MAYDFEKLKAKHIKEYMDEHATKEQKKTFMKVAYVMQKKKKGIPVLDKDGNPIMYQVHDKDGNPKFKANGQPEMRKKLQYVEQEGAPEEKVFCLLSAKWWFAENFPEAVENVPKRKEKDEPKAGDMFADWA